MMRELQEQLVVELAQPAPPLLEQEGELEQLALQLRELQQQVLRRMRNRR
jgi:hypothetical protein